MGPSDPRPQTPTCSQILGLDLFLIELVGELFYPYTDDIDGTNTGYRGQGMGASGKNRQKTAVSILSNKRNTNRDVVT